MSPMCRISVTAVALLSSIGCEERQEDLPRTPRETLDSAGVTITTVGEAAVRAAPALDLNPDPMLLIGADARTPEEAFGRIVNAYRLEDGRIAVADGQALGIRVFGADGTYLSTIGREGEGPGEFLRIWGFERLEGDRLLVLDSRAGRATVFSANGDLLDSRPFDTSICPTREMDGVGQRCQVESAFRDGTLQAADPVGAIFTHALNRRYLRDGLWQSFGVIRDHEFTLIDSLPRAPQPVVPYVAANGRERAVFRDSPYAPEAKYAFGDDHVVLGVSDRFELRFFDAMARLDRILRVEALPVPVEPAHLEPYRAHADTVTRYGTALEEVYFDFPHGETVPFFEDLFLDSTGRLWVQDYFLSWVEPADTPTSWTVFDDAGRPIGRVTLPGTFRLRDAGEGWVLGTQRGEYDVETVVMYEISAQDAAG